MYQFHQAKISVEQEQSLSAFGHPDGEEEDFENSYKIHFIMLYFVVKYQLICEVSLIQW